VVGLDISQHFGDDLFRHPATSKLKRETGAVSFAVSDRPLRPLSGKAPVIQIA
jgi:hypothetical protein